MWVVSQTKEKLGFITLTFIPLVYWQPRLTDTFLALFSRTLFGVLSQLTCHAGHVHQPPLRFPQQRQEGLGHLHSPKEIHLHAVPVGAHGQQLPISREAQDSCIVHNTPEPWEEEKAQGWNTPGKQLRKDYTHELDGDSRPKQRWAEDAHFPLLDQSLPSSHIPETRTWMEMHPRLYPGNVPHT